MRCAAVQKRLSALLLGELGHEEAERLLTHVRVCAECRREMDALGLTMDLLRELPVEPFPDEIDLRLAERIAAEEQARPRRVRAWPVRAATAVAAAAAIIVCACIFVPRLRNALSEPATVLFVRGQPVIAAQRGERPAQAGMPLPAGRRLVTGETDRAVVRLADGSQAFVDFDSCVRVRPRWWGWGKQRRADLEVVSGRAWIWSPGDGEGVRVRFAEYSAFVRSAEAMVAVETETGSGTVRLATLGGESILEGAGPNAALQKGEEMWAGPDGRWQRGSAQARLQTIRIRSRLGRHYAILRAPAVRRAELLRSLATPRALLGIEAGPVSPASAGLVVQRVAPGSPAQAAGVRVGDVLVSIDGTPLVAQDDLLAREITLQDARRAGIVLRRRGRVVQARLELTSTGPIRGCSPESAQRLARAGRMVAQGELVGAEVLYRAALRADPSCVPCRLNLALLEQHQRNWPEAVAVCAEAVRLAPDDADVRTAYGHALLAVGNVRRAGEELVRALQFRPGLARARYLLGLSLLYDGREQECRQEAQQLRAEHGRADLAEMLLGEAEFLKNDPRGFRAAERHFTRAVQSDPLNPDAWAKQGRAQLACGDLAKAQAACTVALRQDPGAFDAPNRLGLTCAQQARLLRDWRAQTTGKKTPGRPTVGAKDLATAGLGGFVHADPNELRRAEDAKWLEAERWFLKALDRAPDEVGTVGNLGSVAYSREELAVAEHHYRRALALDPNYVATHLGLAMALERLGRYVEAEHEYLTALQLDPTEPQARTCLARMWRKQGQLVKEREVYDRYWL